MATKGTACILHNVASGVTGTALRSLVQREVRQMRARGLQEAECLHPLVFQKVQSVLQMKS